MNSTSVLEAADQLGDLFEELDYAILRAFSEQRAKLKLIEDEALSQAHTIRHKHMKQHSTHKSYCIQRLQHFPKFKSRLFGRNETNRVEIPLIQAFLFYERLVYLSDTVVEKPPEHRTIRKWIPDLIEYNPDVDCKSLRFVYDAHFPRILCEEHLLSEDIESPKYTFLMHLRGFNVGIAFSFNTGNIYLTDNYQNVVHAFDKDFQDIGGMSRGMTRGCNMIGPNGIAMSLDEEFIYVVCKQNCCVHIFDRSHNLVRIVGAKGFDPGKFILPNYIAFDLDDNFFVTDEGNCRVQKFSKAGDFILSFTNLGSVGKRLVHPVGIAVNDENEVLVMERSNEYVHVFNTNGEYLRSISIQSYGEGWSCLTRGPNGGFIVCFQNANRINIYDASGKLIKSLVAQNPQAVAFSSAGKLVAISSSKLICW